MLYSKTCLKRPLQKRPKIGLQYQLSLNAGQKFCRMLQEHSAILSTCIKIPSFFKTSVLSIFEWPLKTGFTVLELYMDAKVKGIALDKSISSYCMLNKSCIMS